MRTAHPVLPWLLALAALAARCLRWQWQHGLVDISHEAQVGLARAVHGPLALDLSMGGVHPGWAKAPLHPLLGALAGQLLGDPRLAAIALTWVYAALLVPLAAALARRLAGPAAGPGAALAVLALPFLAVDLREYGLAGALTLGGLLLLLDLRDRPDMVRAAALGLVLGLLACARWEALLWAALLLGGAAAVLLRSSLPGPLAAGRAALVVVPAGLVLAVVEALAYPHSTWPLRLAQRLQLNHLVARSYGGLALAGADIDLADVPGDPLAAAGDGGFLLAWLHALPGALGALLALALHPLAWPVWVLAALGARRLGRRGGLLLATLALPVLALSFMPAKAAYLLLPGCGLAVLAGVGSAGLGPTRRTLVLALLAAAAPASLVLGRLDPDQADRLQTQARAVELLRIELAPGQPLLAEEDLCVLLLGRNPCSFLPPHLDPADPTTRAWLASVPARVAVVDDLATTSLQALVPLAAGPPRPLAGSYHLVPLLPADARPP